MLDTPITIGTYGETVARSDGGVAQATLPARAGDRQSATAYVIDAIEATGAASRHDFDVDAIVTVSHAVAECWDFSSIEQEIFWRIASHFMKD
jgi:hypothetical protein